MWLLSQMQILAFINSGKYDVCLKNNGTVQCARCSNNSNRREKSIAFYDVQCLWFRKPNFSIPWQLHSFFARFSVRALLSLWPFCENLIKFKKKIFFFGAKDERRTTNQPEIFCALWKNSNWSIKVASRSLWWWNDDKNSSFWVA